jgi:hypothetical protein
VDMMFPLYAAPLDSTRRAETHRGACHPASLVTGTMGSIRAVSRLA